MFCKDFNKLLICFPFSGGAVNLTFNEPSSSDCTRLIFDFGSTFTFNFIEIITKCLNLYVINHFIVTITGAKMGIKIIKKEEYLVAAKTVLKTCLNVRSHEKLVILNDNSTYVIGAALYEVAKEDLNLEDVQWHHLEMLSEKRPFKTFPKQLSKALEDVDVSIYAARSLEGELQTFRRPWIQTMVKNGRRHAHMPNITPDEFKHGINTDYIELSKYTQKIYDVLKDAKKLKVKTEAGTDLEITLNPNWNWLKDDGLYRGKPGDKKWGNLPAGEVFATPENVNGVAVIDGCFGDTFSYFGNISKTPVTYRIEEGRVTQLSCPNNSELEEKLKDYVVHHENSTIIGEIGIGTNLGFAKSDWEHKTMLGGEKDARYIHIAIGNGFPDESGAPVERFGCPTHLDGTIGEADLAAIFPNGSIKVIKEKGKFTKEMLD